MRTTIEIDDASMQATLSAGPFKTKKDAVEAGLKLLARQARYRDVLQSEGRLPWQGDPAVDWSGAAPSAEQAAALAQEPAAKPYRRARG